MWRHTAALRKVPCPLQLEIQNDSNLGVFHFLLVVLHEIVVVPELLSESGQLQFDSHSDGSSITAQPVFCALAMQLEVSE